MATLLLQGTINGNLKPEYFAYALIVSLAFLHVGLLIKKVSTDKCQTPIE